MNERLQRWGERALGKVRSVSPRLSSRFEPETAASSVDEQAGFQEIDVETPAPYRPRQPSSSEPPAAVQAPPPEPEHIERKTETPRIAPKVIPHPSAIEPLPPPSQLPKPGVPRIIAAEPAFVREESKQPQRSEEDRDKITPPARPETPPSAKTADTSLVHVVKRLQEWIATPPRERAATQEPAQPPAPKREPPRATPRAETRAPTMPPSPPPARAEPAPVPPQPVVVNIGTIIVRANPAAAPRPPAPPPAAGLATFLARRTAGRP
jgi:hypothetical protein